MFVHSLDRPLCVSHHRFFFPIIFSVRLRRCTQRDIINVAMARRALMWQIQRFAFDNFEMLQRMKWGSEYGMNYYHQKMWRIKKNALRLSHIGQTATTENHIGALRTNRPTENMKNLFRPFSFFFFLVFFYSASFFVNSISKKKYKKHRLQKPSYSCQLCAGPFCSLHESTWKFISIIDLKPRDRSMAIVWGDRDAADATSERFHILNGTAAITNKYA